jgi:hypothetical protein
LVVNSSPVSRTVKCDFKNFIYFYIGKKEEEEMDSTEGEHLKAGHPPALKVTSTSNRSYYANVSKTMKYSSVVQSKAANTAVRRNVTK